MKYHDNLISIVMPAYNAEKWIGAAIESILAQHYFNWELLIIDDGSEDETFFIGKSYVEKDSRISIFRTANSGPSHARRCGIERASGKWLMFMDSDDLLAENALDNYLINADNVDLVIASMREFPEIIIHQGLEEKKYYGNIQELANDFFLYYRKGIMSSLCNKFYRTELLKSVEFQNILYAEDLLVNLEVYPKCKGIRIIPEVTYLYRRENQGSLSRMLIDKKMRIIKQVFRKIVCLLEGDSYQEATRCLFMMDVHIYMKEIVSNDSCTIRQKLHFIKDVISDELVTSREMNWMSLKEWHHRFLWRVVQTKKSGLVYAVYKLYCFLYSQKTKHGRRLQ